VTVLETFVPSGGTRRGRRGHGAAADRILHAVVHLAARPLTAGPVIGEGTVVKKGRSVVFMEAVPRDREGNEYAHATSVGSIRAIPGR
jgi:acyl-coenzyme A thioesterase PaaI-like protein